MDFGWTDAQLDRRQRALDFARAELADEQLTLRDHEGRFSRELWDRCARFGILGLSVPPEYGGEELELPTAMLIMEALGEGCPDNGLTFALNTQLWTVQRPIVRFGTDEQKRRLLPGLCDGRLIGAHALTEPGSGSDAFSLATRAERCAGGYVLNGRKCLITMAPLADVALVFAATNPAVGKWGISAFLIERDTPGFRAEPMQQKMGLRTVPIGELAFEECRVPEDSRLGPEGAGVAISTHSLEVERCCILASQLGAMERQLSRAVDHARTRRQFGQPIGKFQSVSNRLADMKLRIETARLLLYKVAWLVERGKPAMMEAALLKLYLSEAFVESGLDAIRIHGGEGYLSEAGIERDLRDAIGGVIYAGTSDIQRNIVARLLGV
ncbi:MAG TPA: acyl-CoA dehydrogenase family protein [Gemmatimonadaceae bacterium]|nr:acyl-CoA dehydrogenase family protein [Gemmatimonadaceae bacterium]